MSIKPHLRHCEEIYNTYYLYCIIFQQLRLKVKKNRNGEAVMEDESDDGKNRILQHRTIRIARLESVDYFPRSITYYCEGSITIYKHSRLGS